MTATELLSCLTIGALTLVIEQMEAHASELATDGSKAEQAALHAEITNAKLLLADKTEH